MQRLRTCIYTKKVVTFCSSTLKGWFQMRNGYHIIDAHTHIYPDKIADRAGWTNLDPPVGIEYVIIKGKVAVENGCIVDEHLGNFIPYSKLP